MVARVFGSVRPLSPYRHKRVRLSRPGCQNSARTVVFETASNQLLTIGQQRGGETVSRHALHWLAIECKGELALPVNQTTLGKTIGTHATSPIPDSDASLVLSISCVAVSRVTTSQRRQPDV